MKRSWITIAMKPKLHKMTRTSKSVIKRVLCVLLMLSVSGLSAADLNEDGFYRVKTEKPFVDVMEDLAFAIGSNNFRQTSKNTIGAAIRQREVIAFDEATVVHFCNLEYARELLEVSTDYLIHMPCRIAVWQEEESVFLEVKLVPNLLRGNETETVSNINRILISIVNQSVERWSGEKD